MEEHSTDLQKMDTAMCSPISARSSKEDMIFFVDDQKRHFKKNEKVDATVSIYATKTSEVLIANV